MRVLHPISVLLSEPPGLTAGLRLYQRALSGESAEIVAAAGQYLRRSNFARYCDQVVLPGLALATSDVRAGRIGTDQQERIRLTVASVVEALGAAKPRAGASRRRRSTSLIEANVGAHLHAMRQRRVGRAAAGEEVVVCVSMESTREDVPSELLVQALRDERIDARMLGLAATREMPQAEKSRVSTVFLAWPVEETRDAWREAARELRGLLPQAMLVATRLPPDDAVDDASFTGALVDLVVSSF